MNQLTKDYTEKQIQHLIDIFVACSRYELAFLANVMGQKLVNKK